MYVPFPRNLAARPCAAGLVLGAVPHAADPIGRAGIQAQYEQDVANCKKGTTGQDRSACLRELAPPARKPIVSACRRARRPSFSRTCWTAAIASPQASRQDCITQMTSPTQVRGSVQGGGVLRETVIQAPAESAPPPAATPGMAPATGAPMRQ